jgi:hypothetical protein
MARNEVFQGLWPVLAAAGPQDQIMCAGERVDAVYLNETEILKHTVQVFAFAWA